jgi:hypothetical protein
MNLTNEELKLCAEIELQEIASIEQQNWTDEPLTEAEKQVIGMAVSGTYCRLKERGLLLSLDFYDAVKGKDFVEFPPKEKKND